jgi:hypothetical protein
MRHPARLPTVALLLVGLHCRHTPPPAHPAAGVVPGGFSHGARAHAALACVSCHRDEAPPGHDRCARCHPAIFEPAALSGGDRAEPPCAACHAQAPLRVLPARFSHRVHLDRGRMEQVVGFHVGCEDCHALPAEAGSELPGAEGERVPRRVGELPGSGGRRGAATHADCARCHDGRGNALGTVATEAGLPPVTHGDGPAPRLRDCRGCHAGDEPLEIRRKLVGETIRFSHQSHERDRVGRVIPCNACHETAAQARTVADIEPPAMQRCTLCHDDRRVTPPEVRMGRCDGCHLAPMRDVLAPRTHQLGSIAPDDHTLAFRRDHEEAARASGAGCPACHQGLSGSRRDSCQDCHAVMRPRDHTLAFRQQDHGSEAAAARVRCVRCHSADFCEACHRVTPRSHQPLTQWRYGHAEVARFGLRSCFACHTFENTCGQAGCHARGLR